MPLIKASAAIAAHGIVLRLVCFCFVSRLSFFSNTFSEEEARVQNELYRKSVYLNMAPALMMLRGRSLSVCYVLHSQKLTLIKSFRCTQSMDLYHVVHVNYTYLPHHSSSPTPHRKSTIGLHSLHCLCI